VRQTGKTAAGRSETVVGKSGRIRKRHRPLTRQQAKQLSRREREVGLRPEDRRDRTVDLPTPLEKARREAKNRKQG
jgi:hypothetical protein